MNNEDELKEVLKQIEEEGEKKKVEKESESIFTKWWFGLVVVAIIVVVALSILETSKTDDNLIQNNSSNITSNKNVQAKNTSIKVEKIRVEIVDFSKMTKEEIQTWCNNNNIKCSITDKYSDTVEKGMFISQSIAANSTAYQGDKIYITFSLGREPTLGQKNALKRAKSYLSYTSFSYKSLIKQLEYEGYSNEDSIYGADNCGADWNEQAAKKAKSYMDYSSFSKTSLIKQLKYEGFTNEQAEYGASAVGY